MWDYSICNWTKVITSSSYSYGLLQYVNMELVKPVEPVLWACIVELVMGGTGYGTVEALVITAYVLLALGVGSLGGIGIRKQHKQKG